MDSERDDYSDLPRQDVVLWVVVALILVEAVGLFIGVCHLCHELGPP